MVRLEEKVDNSMSDDSNENIQRWTTKRKAALILSIRKGETSVTEAA